MVKRRLAKLTNASFSMVRSMYELERRGSKVRSSIQVLLLERDRQMRASLQIKFSKSHRQGLGLMA